MEGDKIDPASLNVLISPIMLSAYILSYNERRSRQEMESLYDVDDCHLNRESNSLAL